MKNILVISGHDYRSKRRASVHFIADQWSRNNHVRFFSTGFSRLSLIKGDPRSELAPAGGKTEIFGGVECHLQKGVVHPVSLPTLWGHWANAAWLKFFGAFPPEVLKSWISESDIIVIDAGLALSYIPYILRNNKKASLLYHATDTLEAIGSSKGLSNLLEKNIDAFSGIRVPSSAMAGEFCGGNVAVIPHGIDPLCASAQSTTSPYGGGTNAVSVGSMLFDPEPIHVLAREMPDLSIHLIGVGAGGRNVDASNVKVYPEMPFEETQRYIYHADAGLAPYHLDRVTPYLAESSLKLMQYEFHGVPAICPTKAVGKSVHRYGYDDHGTSLLNAARAALEAGRFTPGSGRTWEEVSKSFLSMA